MHGRMARGHAVATVSIGIAVATFGVTATPPPSPSPPHCRCTPPHVCWDEVPWATLNASVNGRLSVGRDALAACLARDGGSLASSACAAALQSTDDEFWVSAQPNAWMHTGLFNEWNVSTKVSQFVVSASTEADVAAAVAFAHTHNLRLVVKGTGHDWYGRSAAGGSLLLWTHPRKGITWHDTFIASGCAPSTASPAVTVQSGVQFADLYPEAKAQGRIVMGGTCDSVGVGGCMTAGCYGPFSKKFGNGAVNMLEARVVLANGTMVTASKCSHPDLFWSLRGGGGGVAGVVTEFTLRTHRSPDFIADASFSGEAANEEDFKLLLAAVLEVLGTTVAPQSNLLCNDGSLGWKGGGPGAGGTVTLSCTAYEGNVGAMKALLQPLADWAAAQRHNTTITSSISAKVGWNASTAPPTDIPWMEKHPDREISTALLASMSKYFPMRLIGTKQGAAAVAAALVEIAGLLPSGQLGTNPFMMAKGQAGLSPDVVAEFAQTAQNPVVLDSAGTLLIMYNIPSLPQVPPSTALLKELWPRLETYAIRDPHDPLSLTCAAGATGNETAAVNCMSEWHARIPALQAKLAAVRDVLWRVLPNEDADGVPLSGSYWAETDYDDRNFQESHWGKDVYAKLLAVKRKYDPDGLFVCHHCVGSEAWTAESELNCRA